MSPGPATGNQNHVRHDLFYFGNRNGGKSVVDCGVAARAREEGGLYPRSAPRWLYRALHLRRHSGCAAVGLRHAARSFVRSHTRTRTHTQRTHAHTHTRDTHTRYAASSLWIRHRSHPPGFDPGAPLWRSGRVGSSRSSKRTWRRPGCSLPPTTRARTHTTRTCCSGCFKPRRSSRSAAPAWAWENLGVAGRCATARVCGRAVGVNAWGGVGWGACACCASPASCAARHHAPCAVCVCDGVFIARVKARHAHAAPWAGSRG